MINVSWAPTFGLTPGERFTATIDACGGLVFAGELTGGALDTLHIALDLALLDPGDLISIDASRLTSIDPSAVSELLRYQLIAAARQRQFCLERATPAVVKTLDLLDVGPILLSRHAFDVAHFEPKGLLRR